MHNTNICSHRMYVRRAVEALRRAWRARDQFYIYSLGRGGRLEWMTLTWPGGIFKWEIWQKAEIKKGENVKLVHRREWLLSLWCERCAFPCRPVTRRLLSTITSTVERRRKLLHKALLSSLQCRSSSVYLLPAAYANIAKAHLWIGLFGPSLKTLVKRKPCFKKLKTERDWQVF